MLVDGFLVKMLVILIVVIVIITVLEAIRKC